MKEQGKTLVVAMADPTDLPLFDAVAQRARARVQTAVAGETESDDADFKIADLLVSKGYATQKELAARIKS